MGITPREQEILSLLDEGLSTGDVADRLGISKAYVGTVRTRFCTGLGIDQRFYEHMAQGSKTLLERITQARAVMQVGADTHGGVDHG